MTQIPPIANIISGWIFNIPISKGKVGPTQHGNRKTTKKQDSSSTSPVSSLWEKKVRNPSEREGEARREGSGERKMIV